MCVRVYAQKRLEQIESNWMEILKQQNKRNKVAQMSKTVKSQWQMTVKELLDDSTTEKNICVQCK